MTVLMPTYQEGLMNRMFVNFMRHVSVTTVLMPTYLGIM